MNESWIWLGRDAAVIFVALVLATALGATDLFSQTRLFADGLSAAHLVRFLGYGGSLVVFWLAARHAMERFRVMGSSWQLAEVMIVPSATLLVVASAHAVFLLILGPLMGKSARVVFDWVFILAIVASAGWLLHALFHVGRPREGSDAPGRSALERGARLHG